LESCRIAEVYLEKLWNYKLWVFLTAFSIL
jgi:hypothetical protein